MITIRNLKKQFNQKILFDNLNIDFENNKINVILGPSGCGKTTLLRIMAGLDLDFHGSLNNIPPNIAYIFQEDRLVPWLNVEENIQFVLKSILPEDEVNRITRHYLEAVKLYDDRHKLPKELSGGMKRRVAIARGFAYPSQLLLMDEPFKGFDELLKNQLIDAFISLQKSEKKTTILITHDLLVANCVADTIYKFKD